jgi:hypothetical protein
MAMRVGRQRSRRSARRTIGRSTESFILATERGRPAAYGSIGAADDNQDADGAIILDFRQAQAKARELFERRKREAASLPTKTGPYTASRSIVEHLEWMERSRKSAQDARHRAEGIILPALGAIACDALSKMAAR